VCQPPAVMAVNGPTDALHCPLPLLPQHTALPSRALMAALCIPPAAMAMNDPLGTLHWPLVFLPQPTNDPLAMRPMQ
jgi:hypothetical protein